MILIIAGSGLSTLYRNENAIFGYFCNMTNRLHRLSSRFVMALTAISLHASAQDAYEIQARIKPFVKGYLYLAHHFGKKQYLVDSALIGSDGLAVFKKKDRLLGGVYMIAFPEKNGWIECLMDRQQRFRVEADTANILGTIRYTGSPDNDVFADYQRESFRLGTEIGVLQKRMAVESPQEAAKTQEIMQQKGAEMTAYRDRIMQEHPNNLLTAIFYVLKEPVLPPAEKHPGGRYDSLFAYRYFRDHYWDHISMTDERLVRTPVFQIRFDRYFDEILPQHPDSLSKAAGELLDAAKPNAEMFKFLLSSLTDKYVNPQFMGMDAVFVYLFEKYYIPGMADAWMNEKYRKFIFDRGYSLISNVIGNKGADFEFLDTAGRKKRLYDISAPFTVICFWDPSCGHCQEEVPRLDSMFQQKWKKQGIALFGMMTDGGKDNWLNYIRKNNLKGWVHGHQTEEMRDALYKAGLPGFRQLYDVYQTPILYALDKEKRIIAKKLNYHQIDDLLDYRLKAAAKPPAK